MQHGAPWEHTARRRCIHSEECDVAAQIGALVIPDFFFAPTPPWPPHFGWGQPQVPERPSAGQVWRRSRRALAPLGREGWGARDQSQA